MQIQRWSSRVESTEQFDDETFFSSWPAEVLHYHVQRAREIHKFLLKTHNDRDSWMSMILQQDEDQLSIIRRGLSTLLKSAKSEGLVLYRDLISYLRIIFDDILSMFAFKSDNLLWLQAMTHNIISPLLEVIQDQEFQQCVVNLCLAHIARAVQFFSSEADMIEAGEAMEGAITIFEIVPPKCNFEKQLAPFMPKIRKHCRLFAACVEQKIDHKAQC